MKLWVGGVFKFQEEWKKNYVAMTRNIFFSVAITMKKTSSPFLWLYIKKRNTGHLTYFLQFYVQNFHRQDYIF